MQVRDVAIGLTVGLCLTLATTPPSGASTTSGEVDRADAHQSEDPGAGEEPLLAGPAHGQAAIAELGPDLAAAAERNDLAAARLRDLLASDRTAWLDSTGRVYFVDRAPASPVEIDQPASTAAYPLDQTFALHSKPGSTKTIFLDFDGQTVSGSAWNQDPSVGGTLLPGAAYEGWTLDGSGSTSDDTERTAIQSIWQRVAEDYAPFDVDVTTADPGDAALNRSNAADTTFGTRAVISSSDPARTSVCQGFSCGGVAYLGVFDIAGATTNYYQPAWVFPQALANDPKYIAEAISHEVGHNLGLEHDGTASQGYYTGQGSWAPIMGVGYYNPIVQFSKGEYAGANNTQDDFAVIRGHGLANRADEAGDTRATAATISTTASGFVATPGDVDVYTIYRSCTTAFTASAVPAPTSPNLDIDLKLTGPDGATLSDNPVSGGTGDLATGMDAAVTSSTAAVGAYSLRVDGSGALDPVTNGYSDYGSVGAYTVSVSSQCPSAAPFVPRSIGIAEDDVAGSASLTWTAPEYDGGSPITSYTLWLDGSQVDTVGSAVRSYTFTGLAYEQDYAVEVRAVNDVGTGPGAGGVARVIRVPGAPTSVAVQGGNSQVTISWAPPANSATVPVTGYQVRAVGAGLVPVTLPESARSYVWPALTNGATYTFSVVALSGGTASPEAVSDPVTPATRPGAARIGKARSGAAGGKITAKAVWSAPVSDGGSSR